MSQPPANGPYGRPFQPDQSGRYGVTSRQSQYGQPGPQAQYGQVGADQPAYGAAGGQQPTASTPQPEYRPSQLGPIPLEQDKVVLKPTATLVSRIQLLVGGGFGLVCLAGAVWNLIHLGDEGTITAFVILLLLGVFLALGVLLLMSVRTVLDATGIHVGGGGRGRDIPWPRSRTGLFVKVSGAPAALSVAAGRPQIRHAEAYVVDNDGKAIALTGLSWSGFSGEALERKGAAELDRIWSWAVARGYTQEAGEYVELSGVLGLQQGLRERQERRHGLSRP